jgi:hypothetical protein
VTRYVFVCTSALGDQALAAARKAARSQGATVVKLLAGKRKTARVPKRKPLERSKARETLAAAKGQIQADKGLNPCTDRLDLRHLGCKSE